jgi:hypothetical protein
MAAAFSNPQVSYMFGRQPEASGVASDPVRARVNLRPALSGDGLQYRLAVVNADNSIDPGSLVEQFLPIALRQAPGDYYSPGVTRRFVLERLGYHSHRFIPRVGQKTARIDYNHVGVIHRRSDNTAAFSQARKHFLGVHQVLRAAQGYE